MSRLNPEKEGSTNNHLQLEGGQRKTILLRRQRSSAMLGKETKVEKNHSIRDKKRKSDGKRASAVKFIKEIKERKHHRNTYM